MGRRRSDHQFKHVGGRYGHEFEWQFSYDEWRNELYVADSPDLRGFPGGPGHRSFEYRRWNVHVGSTAGFLETQGNITGGNTFGGFFNSNTEAPFVGAYAAATKGGFFVDGLLRFDYMQNTLNSPSANVFNQNVDAQGLAIAGSVGYNWAIPNSSWFFEPSAGFVWTRDKVDPFSTNTPVTAAEGFNPGIFSGTTQINDINSAIGRIGF